MGLRIHYGGTFDPVHRGHLAIARAARDQLQVAVRLLPAADPPHRPAPGAPASQRAEMLGLAIEDDAGLILDLRELERARRQPQTPSYTVDTLRELRAELGARQPLAWLVGADSLLGLPGWHEWEALFELAHFIVADRPGSPLEQRLPAPLQQALQGRWARHERELFAAPAGRLLHLQAPLRSESASEVRERIAHGGDWRALVPERVADYITDHRLYGVRAP